MSDFKYAVIVHSEIGPIPVMDDEHNTEFDVDEAIIRSMEVPSSFVVQLPRNAQPGSKYECFVNKETGEHHLYPMDGIPGSM